MVDIKKEDMLWAAYLKKESPDAVDRAFVVVKKGVVYEGSWFHGVGFWVSGPDIDKGLEEPGNPELVEEWIHGSNIDHVRSLMYKPR